MFARHHESLSKDDDCCRWHRPDAVSKAQGRVHTRAVCARCRRYGPDAISKAQGRIHTRAVCVRRSRLSSCNLSFRFSRGEFPYLMETSLEPARMMQPGPMSLDATHACSDDLGVGDLSRRTAALPKLASEALP